MLPLFAKVNVLPTGNEPLAVNAGFAADEDPIVTHAPIVTDADSGFTWSQPAAIAAVRKS